MLDVPEARSGRGYAVTPAVPLDITALRQLASAAIRDGENWNDRRLPEMGRALDSVLDALEAKDFGGRYRALVDRCHAAEAECRTLDAKIIDLARVKDNWHVSAVADRLCAEAAEAALEAANNARISAASNERQWCERANAVEAERDEWRRLAETRREALKQAVGSERIAEIESTLAGVPGEAVQEEGT